MRKICVLLALALTLLPLNAFAAAGDAFILRSDDSGTYHDYVQSITSDGKTLYMLGDQTVYTYHVGEADATAYSLMEANFDLIAAATELLNQEADDEEGTRSTYFDNVAFFCADGKLYRLVSWMRYGNDINLCEEASLYEIVLRDDMTAEYVPVMEHIDWTSMVEDYGDYSYARSVHASCVVGDELFMCLYGSSGNMELRHFNLASGEVELVTELTDYVYSMCPYKDESVLVSFSRYTGEASDRVFCACDLYGNVDEVGKLSGEDSGQVEGMAYDADRDILYGVTGGMVQAMDLNTMTMTEVADMPLANGINTGKAELLDGGYYAVGSYEGVCVRNLDVSSRSEEVLLRLYNGAYSDSVNKAAAALSNMNGNIVVASSNDYMQDDKILENMMNRVETPDIYVLYVNSSAYDAIFNRGFMADMNGSDTARKFIESTYEGIQAKLVRDGEPVAVPVYTYGYTMGINKEALKQLGITIDDVPTNWLDFLLWIKGMEDDHPEKMYVTYREDSFESVKSALFYQIFMDYVNYLNVVGAEKGFDTPELNALMDALESMDFEKWGHEHDDGEGMDYESFEYDSGYVTLLETYTGCSLGNMYDSNFEPILLSISAEAKPLLVLQTAVAFINPYTKNYDAALAYMECLTQSLGNDVLYSISPDYNEPTRYSWYEENVQNAQEYLDTLREDYEKVSEEYKQQYEEYIKEAEENLENAKNQWAISPEQIAWYRSYGDHIYAQSYSALYSNESTDELWSVLEQYFAGMLNYKEMLKQIDKKLQMMILEGQ